MGKYNSLEFDTTLDYPTYTISEAARAMPESSDFKRPSMLFDITSRPLCRPGIVHLRSPCRDAVQPPPFGLRALNQLEHHRQHLAPAQAALAQRPVPDRRKRRFDRIGGAKTHPVRRRKIIECQIRHKALGRFRILGPVLQNHRTPDSPWCAYPPSRSDEGHAWPDPALTSATGSFCVLCIQHRCGCKQLVQRRPEPQRAVADRQTRCPKTPRLQIKQQLRQLCADSRSPSSIASRTFRPSSVTPISTSATASSPRCANRCRCHPHTYTPVVDCSDRGG